MLVLNKKYYFQQTPSPSFIKQTYTPMPIPMDREQALALFNTYFARVYDAPGPDLYPLEMCYLVTITSGEHRIPFVECMSQHGWPTKDGFLNVHEFELGSWSIDDVLPSEQVQEAFKVLGIQWHMENNWDQMNHDNQIQGDQNDIAIFHGYINRYLETYRSEQNINNDGHKHELTIGSFTNKALPLPAPITKKLDTLDMLSVKKKNLYPTDEEAAAMKRLGIEIMGQCRCIG